MECVSDGDLINFLERRGKLNESEARIIVRSVAKTLKFLHSLDIAHRDVKCDNILLRLDPTGEKIISVKLADFGLAAYMEADKFFSTPCGSPPYAAPEIIAMNNYQGSRTDIWALGVVLYILLEAQFPFSQPTTLALKDQIRSGRFLMPRHLSLEVQDLLSRMLNKDIAKRITIDEILNHTWIKMEEEDEVDEESRVVTFVWKGPVSSSAFVTGDFYDWKRRISLQRVSVGDHAAFWVADVLLPPGTYQYKYIIDGKWYYDSSQIVVDDGYGNVNNFIKVSRDGVEHFTESTLSSGGVFNMDLD